MNLSRKNLSFLWRHGLNWVVFFIVWFSFAAIIGGIENSATDGEARLTLEYEVLRRQIMEGLGSIHGESSSLVPKVRELVSKDKFMIILNYLFQIGGNKQLYLSRLNLIEESVQKLREYWPLNDVEGQEVLNGMEEVLKDPKAPDLFCNLHLGCEDAWEEDRLETIKSIFNSTPQVWTMENLENDDWSFGHSLHFISTIFTTLGYGMKIPASPMGKAFTVVMIVTLLPFFVHCVATAVTGLNNLINRLFGVSESYEDLQELTVAPESSQSSAMDRRNLAIKGALALVGLMAVHLLISALYHYSTTGWHFGDVLYFEFVSYSSIGFGDMVPQDEITVAGAILKNILIKIPSCIFILATLVRIWPIIC